MPANANLVASNNRLESRMREIRQSGSVGGETLTRLPYLNPKTFQPVSPSAEVLPGRRPSPLNSQAGP